MNKRNTEGYVLAYLLIVITVMGVIAATLMTSTLQVVTSQEKSLAYMKDKYEAMGEIELFIAELEHAFSLTNAVEGIAEYTSNSDYASHYNAFSGAQNHVSSLLSVPASSKRFESVTVDDNNPNLYDCVYSFTYTSTDSLCDCFCKV